MRSGSGIRRALYDDEGSMTVGTAFIAATVLAVAVAVLLVGRATVASHSARSAADLAALAGANALRAGEPACGVAARVAKENRARVGACVVDDADLVVRAEVAVDLGVFGSRAVTAVARAGPA